MEEKAATQNQSEENFKKSGGGDVWHVARIKTKADKSNKIKVLAKNERTSQTPTQLKRSGNCGSKQHKRKRVKLPWRERRGRKVGRDTMRANSSLASLCAKKKGKDPANNSRTKKSTQAKQTAVCCPYLPTSLPPYLYSTRQ